MPAFDEVRKLDDFAAGKAMLATSGRSTLALYNVDGVLHATEAWCLRCGTLLSDGRLDGCIVACAGCCWRYDVKTGSVIGIPALRLGTFCTKVEVSKIFVADA